MTKGRTEAFSDGVFAIIITIMVLELKIPHGDSWRDLEPLIPVALSYVLSFLYVGIYWNNHHHLFQVIKNVSGGVLWCNIHLLFWLSLIPFVTAWAGENHFSAVPVASYGTVLLMAGIAYFLLTRSLLKQQGGNSDLAHALGKDWKGKISVVTYAVAIPLTVLSSQIALALYVLVAIVWVVPDRRMEKVLSRMEVSK